MLIDLYELKEKYESIWRKLDVFIMKNKKFPCLFAMASLKKEVMNFLVIYSYQDFGKFLPEILTDFNKLTLDSSLEKTYKTLIVVSDYFCINSGDEDKFIRKLLSDLNALDISDWPANKTKNFDDLDYEFYWNNEVWFPVVMHKNHKEEIRRAPLFILAFQSGSVFDYNKNNRIAFYEKMRSSIHKRINDEFSENLPFYLSEKSSGKNICQYSGMDIEESVEQATCLKNAVTD